VARLSGIGDPVEEEAVRAGHEEEESPVEGDELGLRRGAEVRDLDLEARSLPPAGEIEGLELDGGAALDALLRPDVLPGDEDLAQASAEERRRPREAPRRDLVARELEADDDDDVPVAEREGPGPPRGVEGELRARLASGRRSSRDRPGLRSEWSTRGRTCVARGPRPRPSRASRASTSRRRLSSE
jgi:hypothetical protein